MTEATRFRRFSTTSLTRAFSVDTYAKGHPLARTGAQLRGHGHDDQLERRRALAGPAGPADRKAR